MFIINFFLKLFGMYISPEDEESVINAISAIDEATADSQDQYITYSKRNKIKASIQKPTEVLKSTFIPKKKDYYEYAQEALQVAENLDSLIDDSNKRFVEHEQQKAKQLLDDVDGKPLDQQQREVVLTDEDRTLVLAGAGSGKTLTIAGKVKYLCSLRKVAPADILLISFTKKSAKEIEERINKQIGLNIEAYTFHKLGLDIIARVNNAKPDVADSLEDFVKGYFAQNLLYHKKRTEDIIKFLSYYITIPMDFSKYEVVGDAYASQKTAEFESLKSKYNQELWMRNRISEEMKNRTSLKNERMKSMEEVILANFLFLHGVEYQYEYTYPYTQPTAGYRGYHPDFYLPEYDIYIEHFGITEDGRVPWLDAKEEQKYLKGIDWKRNTHKKHGTKLLETYSYMVSQGTFLNKLDQMLKANGVKYNPPSFDDIYKICYAEKDDYHLKEFIKLCCSFIALFKSKGYENKDMGSLFSEATEQISSRPWLAKRYISQRESLFRKIITPVLDEYEKYLNQKNAIDFADMINLATHLIPEDKGINHFKYVIIDEYQDISMARFKLIKTIIEKTNAKLLCVGDDWQSIYRFAGSDISLFTNFEKYMGKTLVQKIEKTYRNSQDLINIAEGFVLKNPNQLKKNLSSGKSLKNPVQFYYYASDPTFALKTIMDEIIGNGETKSIMLLGRTSHDKQMLIDSKLFYEIGNDKMVYKACQQANVTFITVHKSKGIEADNVVILNFKNALLGFPNKISDDPILEKVLNAPDEFLYAEERRLLYVALTRTRNKVYLLVPQDKPSEFMNEFKNLPSVEIHECMAPAEKAENCPMCKTGVLIERENPKTGKKFMGCSNYPQCRYTLSGNLDPEIRCPVCASPMVKRSSIYGDFYGCSRYPECRGTINI